MNSKIVKSETVSILSRIWAISHRKTRKRLDKLSKMKCDRGMKEFFMLASQYPSID